MGGCASAPKDLKDEVGSASAPAPAPATATAPESPKEVETGKVELEAVEKVEENDDDKKSLGSLLNEKEVKKETTSESKAGEIPSKENVQEQEATTVASTAAEPEKEQIKNVDGKATEAKKENH